jgi:membrane-anchored protein YejM (alkaline phosphatase superfamily)
LNWGSGFLPTAHQGVPFQSGGDPILNLTSPKGFNSERQYQVLQAVRDLNQAHLMETADPEVATRIASYEMAYRMQTTGPELIDCSKESKETLALYGAEPGARSFANNCLLARRLVERGVRFVQLYHTDWDQHGGPGTNLNESLDQICQQIDRPCAALIQDLKQRGLLDQTLVVWGGEFGRTPMGEQRETLGRNHHIDAFTMWFAGAGIKSGQTVGSTDELGFNTTEDKVHVHDIQATILHLLGLDHTQLTFKSQGRDFRLTDVSGDVIKKLLA